MSQHSTALDRNISTYPWYVFFRDCLFWGPIFFLYFAETLSLAEAIQLEAIYYICVVVFEVPSGYFSDAWGRRKTLLLSSASLCTAYLLFFLGSSYLAFASAQVLLALGFASASGTDTALHYESLAALGRCDELQRREAVAARASFLAAAVAAVAGGICAMSALTWAYAATIATSLVSCGFVFLFTESDTGERNRDPFLPQVRKLFIKSWTPRLRFFTLFTLGMTVLIHIPYEFYQPFIKQVLPQQLAGRYTSLILGLHLAGTMFIGAWAASKTASIEHRCRKRLALLGCVALQLILIAGMGLFFHPLMAVLLSFRTVAKGLSGPLVNVELGPLLRNDERSTYLSLQSLMGRLSLGLVLLLLPMTNQLHGNPLAANLLAVTGLGVLVLLLLWRMSFPRGQGKCCANHSHHHRAEARPQGGG